MKSIAFDPSIPVSGLSLRMPMQVAKVLLSETIKLYANLSHPQSTSLREIIQTHLKVWDAPEGIKKANPGQVKRALEEQWFNNPNLAAAILNTWSSQHEALKHTCMEFMETPSDLMGRLLRQLKNTVACDDPSALADIVQTIEENHPGIAAIEDIWLAVTLALSDPMFHSSMSENKEEVVMEANTLDEPKGTSPIHAEGWDEILGLLRSIAPEDPRWQTFDAFMKAAAEIANQQQEALLRHQHAHELASIFESCHPLIIEQAAYFEIEEVETWSPAEVANEHLGDAVRTVQVLHQQLEEFKHRKDSLSRTQRFQTEELIIKTFQAVQDFFTRLQAPSAPEVATSPAAETTVTVTEYVSPTNHVDTPEQNTNIAGEPLSGENPEVPAALEALVIEETESVDATPGKKPEDTSALPDEPTPVPGTGADTQQAMELPLEEKEFINEPHSEAVKDLAQAPGIENEALSYDEEDFPSETPEPYDLPVPSYPEEEVVKDEGEEPPAAEEYGLPVPLLRSPLPVVSVAEADEELLRRLEKHDLSTAYWLAWASEQLGNQPAFPSWLIAAMQGAISSIELWPEQKTAFRESIAEFVQPDQRLFEKADHTALFGLAAGLHFNLIDSTGRWSSWSEVSLPGEFPDLSSIIHLILEASQRGRFLDPLKLQTLWNRAAVDNHAKELADRVGQWLRTANEKGARIVRAMKVWQDLVKPGRGELYKWLDLVAHDQRKKIHEVKNYLDVWNDRGSISTMIHRLDQQINGHHARPIDGEARDQIVGWVVDICTLAQEWCNTVNSLSTEEEGNDWELEQTHQFCGSLQAHIKQAITDVTKAKANVNNPLMRVSFDLFIHMLLGMNGMVTPAEKQTLSSMFVLWLSRSDDLNLRSLLTRSLLLYPELELDSLGMPAPEQAADICSAITTFQNRTVEDAIQGWINLGDYRFIDTLLGQVQNAEIWETRVREALRMNVRRLERLEIPETVVAIEQALLETLIAEGEYSEYVSWVESVRKQIRQTESNNGKYTSIRKLSNRLTEIREVLKTNRSKRLASQQKHWENLRDRLAQVAQDSENIVKISADFKAKIEAAVDISFNEGDLRTAGEYLAQLDASLALPIPKLPDEAVFETSEDKNPIFLADFLHHLNDYVQMLKPHGGLSWSQIIHEVGDPNSTLLEIPSGSLPALRRKEAQQAMESWRYLKTRQDDQGAKNLSHVTTLMRYLGFEVTSPSPVSVSNLPSGMRDYQLWRVAASAGVFSPVAQFGSQRKESYQVLGVWNRPGMETLGAQVSALMQKTGDEPTIVFYFHVLTSPQRQDLFSVTHRNKLPILVVDEAIILHLARERENRLPTLFACTLPFTALNPYFPAAAGLIPPEVFKGRSEQIRNLINPQGSIIIYGGRQLGKSALLRQVERGFNHPRDGKLVIYEDIKLVGAVGADKDYQVDLRDHLAPKLISLGLLDSSAASDDIGKILLQVEQKVKNKHVQLRLLLDESDNFLSADALRNFPVVQQLKNTMEQTDHAFKFILAGLHNVQRFGRIPNHPIAHLGDPIQIGPLSPQPARDLLMEPLHALGFHFGNDLSHEDTSLPLHILSYTNRHPGLIQYFGAELVKHMLEKNQRPSLPPLRISRADVEQVYRKKEVRDKICERFNLTLDLDPRYTAITLVVILEQWDDQNGFDRLYSAQLLRQKAASWWPEAFGEEAITPEGFKGILEEMVGLGVLAVSQDENSFRLRSPNLVYLMGTHEEIWDRLARLCGTVPPGQNALNSHHARLQNLEFSPFTFSQERVLNNPRSGVALIFGLNASGYGNLNEALRRLPVAKNRFSQVRIAASGADAIVQQLKNRMREHPESGLFIAHREMHDNMNMMAEEVQAAIQYCTQIKDPILRVCFSFDSQAAWQWFQLPYKLREQIEERALVMSLQCWDRIGVQQRLEMETSEGKEMMVPEKLLTRVVDATGGWMTLLDTYITACRSKDPAAALENFQQLIHPKEGQLAKQFITELGIYEHAPREIIEVLLDPQFKQMVKEEPAAFLDLLEVMVKGQSKEGTRNAVEYLQRLSIIVSEPYQDLDPIISRCWNAA